MDTTALLLIALVVYLLAGTVKGVVGIGLPTAAIGMMSQLIQPGTAIALVIIPMIVTNIWQVYRCGQVRSSIRRYWRFMLSLAVVISVSSRFATQVSQSALMLVMGITIVIFSLDTLWRKPWVLPASYDRITQYLAGIAGGVMGGFAGIWSPPMVGYLLAIGVDRDEFVRALGLLILVGSVFLGIGYWQTGLLSVEIAKASVFVTVAALLGFVIGERIRRRLDAARFKKLVLVLFIVMGLNLIRRALVVWPA